MHSHDKGPPPPPLPLAATNYVRLCTCKNEVQRDELRTCKDDLYKFSLGTVGAGLLALPRPTLAMERMMSDMLFRWFLQISTPVLWHVLVDVNAQHTQNTHIRLKIHRTGC